MIWSLQYLRAIAALLVVMAHSVEDAGGSFAHFGNFGVDVFFVISGYIMWTISGPGGREGSAGDFARRRFARIVPMYWIATFLTIICLRTVPAIAYVAAWPRLSDIVQSIVFIPHRDAHGRLIPILSQGWTIDLEVWFYAVMTIALCCRHRALIIVAGLSVISIAWNPIALEFGAGVAIAASGWRPNQLRSIGLVAAAAIGALADLPLPRVIGWGVPAVALVTGMLGLDRFMPRWRALRRLGDVSFSVYLFHNFITTPAKALLPGAAATVVAMVGASCLGFALYPLERWIQKATLAGLERLRIEPKYI